METSQYSREVLDDWHTGKRQADLHDFFDALVSRVTAAAGFAFTAAANQLPVIGGAGIDDLVIFLFTKGTAH